MKVDEVADFLIKEGVRPRFFAINTVVADDAVVLYQEGPARWVVFYAERGVRSSERVYDSEDAACQALIKKTLNMEKWMRERESRPHRPHPVTPKPEPVKKDPDFIEPFSPELAVQSRGSARWRGRDWAGGGGGARGGRPG